MTLEERVEALEKELQKMKDIEAIKEEISMHMGHTPEITIDSETTATGRWYLEDKLIFTDGKYKDVGINGGAFYTDKYEKIEGQWYILETGYVRIYEEHFMRDPKIHITMNMHK